MGAGIKRIRPPKTRDAAAFMRMLFLRTEQELINEINRKRRAGLVEYAEAASLERVQQILQGMVDESWDYVPKMVETIFYHSDKDAAGYRNARVLTAAQTDIVQQLSNNLLGELTEASETAFKSVQKLYTIARLEADPFREAALKEVLSQEAAGADGIRQPQKWPGRCRTGALLRSLIRRGGTGACKVTETWPCGRPPGRRRLRRCLPRIIMICGRL